VVLFSKSYVFEVYGSEVFIRFRSVLRKQENGKTSKPYTEIRIFFTHFTSCLFGRIGHFAYLIPVNFY